MKKAWIIGLIVLLISAGLWWWLSDDDQPEAANPAPQSGQPAQSDETPASDASADQAQTVNVIYTSDGFSPASVTVKVGDSVTWQNQSGNPMQVASNVHPDHDEYPGFDQLAPGSSYTFTFDQAGTWGYHNHEQDRHEGTVIVIDEEPV